MEPLSAVSLAGTVVEFTQFALRITSLARAVRAARQAEVSFGSDLSDRVRRLRKLHIELASGRDTLQGKIEDEHRTLKDVCIDCCQHAQQLDSFMKSLQRSASGKHAPGALAAFKMVWHEGRIRDLQTQLQQKQNEMHLYITNYKHNLELERLDGLDAASSSIAHGVTTNQETMELISCKISRLITKLDAHDETEKQRQAALLSQLRFHGMRSRYFAVKDACKGSAHWIYTALEADQTQSFEEWLSNDDGVFWITGKPGSGKSTIMKFVSDRERTREALCKWNDGRCPTLANYFFWVGDNDLARSQVGLAKALLHDVLAQNRHIVEDIVNLFASSPDLSVGHVDQHFAERFQSMDEFFILLRYVAQRSDLTSKCCFFIDGLDESDSPPRELCDFICELGSYHNIKVCASSRPWIEFQDAFEAMSCKVLRVHEHTRDDMHLYVHGLLEQDRVFKALANRDMRYHEAVSKLVDRAQGVFLWTFLVVRSLRNSLNSAFTFADFQSKLQELPSDLHEFFLRMLDLPPPHYKQRAAQICLMVLSSKNPLRVIQVRPLFVDDTEGLIHAEANTKGNRLRHSCNATYARIKAYCTDLIEIHEDLALKSREDNVFRCPGVDDGTGIDICGYERIAFVHRTVGEFFKTPNIHSKIVQQAGENFDVGLALCSAQYDHIKELPLRLLSLSRHPAMSNPGILNAVKSVQEITTEQLLPSLVLQARATRAGNHRQAEQILDKTETLLRAEFERADFDWLPQILPGRLLATLPYSTGYTDSDMQRLCVSIGTVLVFALCVELDWYVLHRIRTLSTSGFATNLERTKYLTDLLRLTFEMVYIRHITRVDLAPEYSNKRLGIAPQVVAPSLVKVIESLLHEGASPNVCADQNVGANNGKSVWKLILKRFARLLQGDSQLTGELDAAQTVCVVRIIDVLLVNGARPDMVVFITDGPLFAPTTMEDIINSPPLSEHREDLLKTLRQSRRRWERRHEEEAGPPKKRLHLEEA